MRYSEGCGGWREKLKEDLKEKEEKEQIKKFRKNRGMIEGRKMCGKKIKFLKKKSQRNK